jgi:GTP cyclohydrolase I
LRGIPIESATGDAVASFADIGYLPRLGRISAPEALALLNKLAIESPSQERLASKTADALDQLLRPLGVGVVIEMICRTDRSGETPASVITQKLVGALRDREDVRFEFLALTRRKVPRGRS